MVIKEEYKKFGLVKMLYKKRIEHVDKNKVSIKIDSFDKLFYLFFFFKLKKIFNIPYSLFKLPRKKKLFTLLRSPFANKNSRIQIGFLTNSWILSFQFLNITKIYWKNRNNFNTFMKNVFNSCSLPSRFKTTIKFFRFSKNF